MIIGCYLTTSGEENIINATIAGISTTSGILTPSDCNRSSTVISGFSGEEQIIITINNVLRTWITMTIGCNTTTYGGEKKTKMRLLILILRYVVVNESNNWL